MNLPVGWMNSSSSIERFSIIISCRNSLRVYVEDWEYLSWTWCTLAGQCVFLVRGVRKGACPDSKSLIFVDIFPDNYGEEGINRSIVV